MVQASAGPKVVKLRHFKLNEESAFVQISMEITTGMYAELTGKPCGYKNNKGKMLVQCLDRSGSMTGLPYQTLKRCCQGVGL
jgi:uncharacterized protein with von Willebrand factor type A (vWA) domain